MKVRLGHLGIMYVHVDSRDLSAREASSMEAAKGELRPKNREMMRKMVDTYESPHSTAEKRGKPISYAFRGQIISPFYGPLKYKSSSKLNSSLRTPTWRTITSIL